jgi:hypothetical protein
MNKAQIEQALRLQELCVAAAAKESFMPGGYAASVAALRAHLEACSVPDGETTRPANSQEWAGMSGSTAFLLIQRHADGWPDIDLMMGEWLAANSAQAVPVAHAVPDGMVLVPVEPTPEMKKAAVVFANGSAVYKNVQAGVLEIEEGIYGEAYEAMLAAAPQPAQAVPDAPLSFNCTNGCGACGIKLVDFVTHATQAQDGDPWVTVASEPQIVSACCGSAVEVWDERSQSTVANVIAATPHLVVSDEMVTAYLNANTAYWKQVDETPQSKRNPARWRNGTPSEATRVSLIAALGAAQPEPEPAGFEQVYTNAVK